MNKNKSSKTDKLDVTIQYNIVQRIAKRKTIVRKANERF